jgi:hypothetical protein
MAAGEMIFVIQDDRTVRPLPLRLWADLAHGRKGLPEYTLSAVRVVDVWVDSGPDRAQIIQKVGAGYHLNFGPDGQLRVGDAGVDTSGAPWIPTEFELEAIRASIHGKAQDGVVPPNLGATQRGCDDTFSIVSTCGDSNPAIAPSVGIFWEARELDSGWWVLINEKCNLEEAKVDGNFLTYPHGHSEIWERIKAVSPTQIMKTVLPITITYDDYAEAPRGKVVFNNPDQQFIIYADPKMHGPVVRKAIAKAFCLPNCKYVSKLDERV